MAASLCTYNRPTWLRAQRRSLAVPERFCAHGADAARLKMPRETLEHPQVGVELAGHARSHRLYEVAGQLARHRCAGYSEGVSSALRDPWA